MARKKKRKQRVGMTVWLVLFALLLVLLLFLLFGELKERGLLFGGKERTDTAPLNDRSASDFSRVGDRIAYPGALTGIDVSEHQGQIDWNAVRQDGIDFAVIRMGFRGSTVGKITVDGQFYANLNGAKAAGIGVGVYFYSQANCEAEAIEEAEYVLAAVSGYTLDYPIFYDWEEGTPRSERLEGVTMSDVASFAEAFCKTVEAGGYRAGIYFNQKYGYGMNLNALRQYSFWLAQFSDAMTFRYDTELWQYTYQGRVDGIETDVDLDLAFQGNDDNGEYK